MFEPDNENLIPETLPISFKIEKFLVEHQKTIIAAGIVLAAIYFFMSNKEELPMAEPIKHRKKLGK